MNRLIELISKSIEVDILTAEEDIEKIINDNDMESSNKIESIKNKLDIIVRKTDIQQKWGELVVNMVSSDKTGSKNGSE